MQMLCIPIFVILIACHRKKLERHYNHVWDFSGVQKKILFFPLSFLVGVSLGEVTATFLAPEGWVGVLVCISLGPLYKGVGLRDP